MRWLVIFFSIMMCSPVHAAKLDALLSRAMQGRAIPAMAVLVIRGGRVADFAVRGIREADLPNRVQPDDVWHIGSDTKAMTATLIARLVENGRLSWNTPLSESLPELMPGSQPDYHNITMIDMFAHRAGFKDAIDSDFYDAFYTDRRPLHEQRLAYMRMALAQPAAYPPGTQNVYSNRGPLLAAVIAERATGMSYETLMQREIFTPLRMRTAAFGPTHRGQPLGHERGAPQSGAQSDNPAVLAPSGGIHLSMQDWAEFAIDQMKGEHGQGKLLKPQTYRFLHTAQGDTVYGIGWGVRSELDGLYGRFLTHSGSNGYWWARIVLVPDLERGVLIVANASQDDGADEAADQIEKLILPALVSAPMPRSQ